MIHNIILIDASYSMKNKINNILISINNLILKNKNKDVYFTIAYFNNTIHFLIKFTYADYIVKPITFTDLCYFGGSTALYDSIYEILDEFSSCTNFHNNFIILTDGDDNKSTKYNKEIIENLFDKFIKSGLWTIIHYYIDDIESLFNISNDTKINETDLDCIFSKLKI